MRTIDVLKKARALLVSKGWTQGEYAKDKYGGNAYGVANAVCFCSLGALGAASGEGWGRQAIELALWPAAKQLVPGANDGVDIVAWNDKPGRTLEEVLAAFDAAIKREQDAEDDALLKALGA